MAALLVQANNHGTLDLEVVRDEARLAGLYEIYYNEQSRVVSFASTDDHSSPVRVRSPRGRPERGRCDGAAFAAVWA